MKFELESQQFLTFDQTAAEILFTYGSVKNKSA